MDERPAIVVTNEPEVVTASSLTMEDIRSLVYTIRGKQVMLDSDLARIYGYEVRALNQQVKRNIGRFPEDFMFQLTREEIDLVKSQFVISPESHFYSGQEGGRRKPPYVFTEQGIYMLATVLKGEIAERQSVYIMRAFREMRHFLSNNALMLEKISHIELNLLEYQKRTDEKIGELFDYLGAHEEVPQKLFFQGQIYDAFSFLVKLIQSAEQDIILIDGYVDVNTLNLLAKKGPDVSVEIYTFPKTGLTVKDVNKFNAQYPKLRVYKTNEFHDRFLILDGEKVYHVGASLKDAGKKCFGVSLMEDAGLRQALLERLEK